MGKKLSDNYLTVSVKLHESGRVGRNYNIDEELAGTTRREEAMEEVVYCYNNIWN